jgi:tetratricopeptide (TPR) repeat protein
MRKWILVSKIIRRFLMKPSSSYFSVVESVCKTELAKKPEDFYTNWFLGELYVQHKEHNKAIKILEPLFRSGKGGQRLKEVLSRAYFNSKEYGKVINVLKSVKINDAKSTTYYLGVSLIEEGDQKAGLEYLEKYRLKHPDDHNIHWKIGYEYFRLNDFEKALNSYVEARRLKPCAKLDEGIRLCHERLGTTIH